MKNWMNCPDIYVGDKENPNITGFSPNSSAKPGVFLLFIIHGLKAVAIQKEISIFIYMKNLTEIKKLLEYHKQGLKEKYYIKNIGLFGSVVRGDFSASSDVDILVEFERPIGLDFVIQEDELEEILGTKVHLVTPNAIKPQMFKYIKQDLIYV